MTARSLFLSSLLFTLASQTDLIAAPQPDHAIVPGYERFRSDGLSSVEAGKLLLSELNCISCHQASVNTSLPHRSAPVLTDVADRIQPEYLEKYLADPFATKPGTAMPQTLDGPTSAEQAKALAHFLAQKSSVVPTSASSVAVKKGESLFHAVGCASCHGDLRANAPESVSFAMPLGTLHEKYSIASLTKFLQDPHVVRPSGRMPSLNLEAKQAGFIASYLLKETKADPVMKYQYFEGGWQKLPDFSTLQPKSTGDATEISIAVAERSEEFALRFESNLHLRTTGKYKFWLTSDDASRLSIDGKEVILHDGVHAASTKTAEIDLEKGPNSIVVEYVEWHGQEELSLEISSNKMERQSLNSMLSLSADPTALASNFVADPELVKQGAALFVTAGCASCHQHGKVTPATKPFGQSLIRLNARSTAGCLSGSENSPRFHLSSQQVSDLQAAITDLQSPNQVAMTDEQHVHSTLLTLNCYACHSRNEFGGVPEKLNHVFSGTVPEMGDETRIPPTLTNVGDKLRASWMTKVLNEGAKNRPYMKTRMPRFGKQNVGDLVNQFAALDAKTEIAEVEYDEPEHRILAAGRSMVGDQALSCIKCHSFGPHKATGIQSLDMTTMTSRLRRDWFHRYLMDPQAYRRGTRMPAAWPNGKTILKKVLNGDTPQQIQAIWDYLDQGDKAAIPSGLEKKAIVLKPIDRPIIYRNFIEGLSPRGIAVGHPEKVHYAWDAHEMNLKLIWHNQFIDASRHWTGRGQGFQSPLGDHVMKLPGGVPFATLESLDGVWPKESARESGFRFRGYQLSSQGQPAFEYSFGNITVTDSTLPMEALPDAKLVRKLSLTLRDSASPPDRLYFRLAAGAKVERDESGLKVDSITYKISSQVRTILRNSGQEEVLVEIKFDEDGKSELEYVMSW